jgi:hypothetical protein
MFGVVSSSTMIRMKTVRAAQDEVLVRLSYDEALVLSDLLDRWS